MSHMPDGGMNAPYRNFYLLFYLKQYLLLVPLTKLAIDLAMHLLLGVMLGFVVKLTLTKREIPFCRLLAVPEIFSHI